MRQVLSLIQKQILNELQSSNRLTGCKIVYKYKKGVIYYVWK